MRIRIPAAEVEESRTKDGPRRMGLGLVVLAGGGSLCSFFWEGGAARCEARCGAAVPGAVGRGRGVARAGVEARAAQRRGGSELTPLRFSPAAASR